MVRWTHIASDSDARSFSAKFDPLPILIGYRYEFRLYPKVGNGPENIRPGWNVRNLECAVGMDFGIYRQLGSCLRQVRPQRWQSRTRWNDQASADRNCRRRHHDVEISVPDVWNHQSR